LMVVSRTRRELLQPDKNKTATNKNANMGDKRMAFMMGNYSMKSWELTASIFQYKNVPEI